MPRLEDGTGYYDVDTSVAAAQHVSGTGRAAILRKRVMDAYHASLWGLTADEAAAEVGATVLAVRPRVSELLEAGKLVDTGIRRKNASGRSAAVLKVAP